MYDFFIGIDPGKKGAIVTIDESSKIIDCMEFKNNPFHGTLRYLQFYSAKLIIGIEKSKTFSKQGLVSGFNYGVGYGEIIGSIKNSGFPYIEIETKSWKKYFDLIIKHKAYEKLYQKKKINKIRAWEKAKMITDFNFMTNKGGLKDGVVDAFLIAEYMKSFGHKLKD
jgi:hypothetical protein